MLAERLSWRNPRAPYPLDPQDLVTVVLWDPDFHEGDDDEPDAVYWYICVKHDRTYRHGSCAPGPHEVALLCSRHGFENRWPDDVMRQHPAGFQPQLSDDQLAELERLSG